MIARESVRAIRGRFLRENALVGCATVLVLGIVSFLTQRGLNFTPIQSSGNQVIETAAQIFLSILIALVFLFVWGLIYQPARLHEELSSKLKKGEPICVTEFNESQRVGITLKYPTQNKVTGLQVEFSEDPIDLTDEVHPKTYSISRTNRQFLLTDKEIPVDQERHIILADLGEHDRIEFCLNQRVPFNKFHNRLKDDGCTERYAVIKVAVVVYGEIDGIPTEKTQFVAMLHYARSMQQIDQATGKPYDRPSTAIMELEVITDEKATTAKLNN